MGHPNSFIPTIRDKRETHRPPGPTRPRAFRPILHSFDALPAGSMVGPENGAARASKRVFEIYSVQLCKYKTLYARLLTRAALFGSSRR
jgi:hypothetical protein